MNATSPDDARLGEQRFRLARHLTIIDEGSAGTFVIDDRQAWRVHADVARAVLDRLASHPGGMTADELRTEPASLDDEAMAVALEELRLIGAVVVRKGTQIPEQLGALADAMQSGIQRSTIDGSSVHQHPVMRRTVQLTGVDVGRSVISELAAILGANGFTVAPGRPSDDDLGTGAGSSSPAFSVVVARDFLAPAVTGALGAAHRNSEASVAVRLSARSVALSPVFTPRDRATRLTRAAGPGPCPECLRHQLQRNVDPDLASARSLGRDVLGRDAHGGVYGGAGTGQGAHLAEIPRPLVGIAANLLVLLLTRTMLDDEQPLEAAPPDSEVLVWDAGTLTISRHPVRRRAQCPTCGDAKLLTRQHTRAIGLTRRPVNAGPGYRAIDAQRWLADKQHLFDPVTGLISDVIDLGLVGDAHVVRGRHPVVREAAGWRQAVALGRGPNLDAARASLLGEAVERYSAAWHGDEPVVLGTREALGSEAVPPERVALFSDSQRAHRWPAQETIPERLPVDALVAWTPVHTFPLGEQRLLPTSGLFFGHRDPSPTTYATPDSNGCAAGDSLEEALLYALLELIERDAVGIWWYSRSRRPRVRDAEADRLAEGVRGSPDLAGRDLWLLDLTTDLGVPVVAAVTRRTDRRAGESEEIVFGFGAHLDLGRAAARALGEVAQMLAVGPQARNPGHRIRHRAAEYFWAEATLDEVPYLAPSPDATAAPQRVTATGDLLDDALNVTRRLAIAGLEVLTIDLTRPDTGIHVVRAIVPGLRHFWPRLAPGRLYDVPLALRWSGTPFGEGDCNPLPLFV